MDIKEILALLSSSIFIFGPALYANQDILKRKKWLNIYNNNHLIAPNIIKPKFYFGDINYKEKEVLKPLIEVLKNNVSTNDLANVYENMKTLLVIKEKYSIFNSVLGTYGPMENILTYSKQNALSHEFIHMASSEYDLNTDISYCGFSQYLTDTAHIGYSLNEGYTELLNNRYYLKNQKPKKYKSLSEIALLMEKIITEEEMIHLFFSHNLPGLIEKLSNYTDEENATNLIFNIDKYETFYNAFSPFAIIFLAKIEFTLYNLYCEKTNDPVKIKEFENIINQNKLFSLIFSLSRKEISKKDFTDILKEDNTKQKSLHK